MSEDGRLKDEGERIQFALVRRWKKHVGKKATTRLRFEMAGDVAREVLISIGRLWAERP